MENTRTKILEILRKRREATVEDLTSTLELAPATVRRHLDILQRDGHVKVRSVRRQTGRPHYVFSMTEAGEDLFPHHYVRITNRLIEEVVALRPEDTSGQSGPEIAKIVFERMAERLARDYAARVTGVSLGERVAQVAQLLAAEGVLLEARPQGDDYLLLGRGCPCQHLAGKEVGVCAHDRRLLSLLLRADVDALEPEAGPDALSAYVVRHRAPGRL